MPFQEVPSASAAAPLREVKMGIFDKAGSVFGNEPGDEKKTGARLVKKRLKRHRYSTR